MQNYKEAKEVIKDDIRDISKFNFNIVATKILPNKKLTSSSGSINHNLILQNSNTFTIVAVASVNQVVLTSSVNNSNTTAPTIHPSPKPKPVVIVEKKKETDREINFARQMTDFYLMKNKNELKISSFGLNIFQFKLNTSNTSNKSNKSLENEKLRTEIENNKKEIKSLKDLINLTNNEMNKELSKEHIKIKSIQSELDNKNNLYSDLLESTQNNQNEYIKVIDSLKKRLEKHDSRYFYLINNESFLIRNSTKRVVLKEKVDAEVQTINNSVS